MSVYVYVRQSSGDNDHSISCDQQQENALLFAKKNNLTVEKVFSDLNTSGRLYCKQFASLAQVDLVYQKFLKETKKEGQWRTGLGDLFDALKDGDTIIVDDLTRFCRPLTNSYLESALTQFLIEKNIKLLTVKTGEVKLNNFNDNLINALQNRINDNQLTIQRKKAKDSIKRLIDSGELHQSIGMMLGYKFTGRKKEVEVDQQKAPIIQFIFNSFIGGKNIYWIVREIDKQFNFKTCTKSIKNVIERPLYAGYMYDTNGNLIKAKQVEGKEIIDFNTWKLAKDILDSRKYNNIKIKKHYIHYTGMVYCGKCGSRLRVCINTKSKESNPKGKYINFRCLNYSIRNVENCGISIGANTTYKKGLCLDEALQPILILGLLKKLSLSNNQTEKDALVQKRIELQNLINTENKLTEMFVGGLLDSKVYEQNLKVQKEKKDVLQQEIVQLENDLAEDNTEHLRLMVNKIVGRGLTYEEYHSLIPYTIEQIDVFEQEIKVKTFFGDICLPRKRLRGVWTLPDYKWRNMGDDFKIYYHFETFNIYKTQIKLFTYNNFTIYVQGD